MAQTTERTRAAKKAPTKTRRVRNTAATRAQTPSVPPEQILGRAMLANVCISMWEGRKHDREITAEVTTAHKAAEDAGRWHKDLFGGKVAERSAIITAAANLRGIHYDNTLPWSDAGWRLLPTANFAEYTTLMRAGIGRFNAAADAWAAIFEERVAEARIKLGDMYDPKDYPSAQRVRSKYRISLDFSPLPAGGDFRVTLPQEELAQLAADVEDRVARSVRLAMHEAWTRLGDEVATMRDKLHDGKYLRESMVERVRGVAEVLGRLNLTADPALESTRQRVLTELTTFSAETLRDDDGIRNKTARAADDILKAMQGVYTPAVADEED